MGFSGPEYWSSLPCLPRGDLLDPGIASMFPALEVDSLPLNHWGSPVNDWLDKYTHSHTHTHTHTHTLTHIHTPLTIDWYLDGYESFLHLSSHPSHQCQQHSQSFHGVETTSIVFLIFQKWLGFRIINFTGWVTWLADGSSAAVT